MGFLDRLFAKVHALWQSDRFRRDLREEIGRREGRCLQELVAVGVSCLA